MTELFREMVDDVMEEHGEELRVMCDQLVASGMEEKNATRVAF